MSSIIRLFLLLVLIQLYIHFSLINCININTKVDKINVFNREIHIFRDDLRFVNGVNGNKARKLKFLMENNDTLPKAIISYGGIQSNSMYAISKLSSFHNVKFIYLCKAIPKHLKLNPIGCYGLSLINGMQVIEIDELKYSSLSMNGPNDMFISDLNLSYNCSSILWIPQGAAFPLAEIGIKDLAKEILDYVISCQSMKPWKIIVASGTGTVSYYLNKNIKAISIELQINIDIEVIAAPCATSTNQLLYDMSKYIGDANTESMPTILNSEANARIFSKPCKEHLDIWNKLRFDSDIDTFDLIYAPRTFELLLSKTYRNIDSKDYDCLYDNNDINILYYHCGGDEGNQSQLARYKYLKLL